MNKILVLLACLVPVMAFGQSIETVQRSEPAKQDTRRPGVELRHLAVKHTGSEITVMWRTSGEGRILGYEIQRSTGLPVWETVGYTEARRVPKKTQSYEFTDLPSSGTRAHPVLFYRLRLIDAGGAGMYSTIVPVETRPAAPVYGLMQTRIAAAEGAGGIDFSLPREERVSLVVEDITGNTILRLYSNVLLEPGAYVAALDSNALPEGTYLCSLITPAMRCSRAMQVRR